MVVRDLIRLGSQRYGSEAKFATAMGLSRASMNQRKKGDTAVSLEEALHWCESLGVSLDELGGINRPSDESRPTIEGMLNDILTFTERTYARVMTLAHLPVPLSNAASIESTSLDDSRGETREEMPGVRERMQRLKNKPGSSAAKREGKK